MNVTWNNANVRNWIDRHGSIAIYHDKSWHFAFPRAYREEGIEWYYSTLVFEAKGRVGRFWHRNMPKRLVPLEVVKEFNNRAIRLVEFLSQYKDGQSKDQMMKAVQLPNIQKQVEEILQPGSVRVSSWFVDHAHIYDEDVERVVEEERERRWKEDKSNDNSPDFLYNDAEDIFGGME